MVSKASRQRAVIALDVGGTTVDGAVLSPDGEILSTDRIESPADQPVGDITAALAHLIQGLRQKAEAANIPIAGCGIGMPGPFDYKSGVSWMEHKFPALYGFNLGAALTSSTGLPVDFVNDAAAFGLGVAASIGAPRERLLVLTLGTGLGSSFLVDNRIVERGSGVPNGGQLWNLDFRQGRLEDYVAKNAIEQSYTGRGGADISVREIAQAARQGDPAAVATFSDMGRALGCGLALAGKSFHPDRIIIGGQIGQAMDLFGPAATVEYQRITGRPLHLEEAAIEGAALRGAGVHAVRSRTRGVPGLG